MNEATVAAILRAARAEARRSGRSQVHPGYRLSVVIEPQPMGSTPPVVYRVRGREVTFGAAAAAMVEAINAAK
ncbi:hypothetical protein [Variovorax sp. YR216]|uniref:hypothetical protein n=1 Tax=Variovorax sp. YR216 TaxID=1882828 RepID=UPI00115FD6B7|nr:hypothetical protein [Variovorax sp. YR216]